MVLLRNTDKKPDAAIEMLKQAVISEAAGKWNESFDNEYPKHGFGIAELAPYHLQSGGAGWGNSNFWSVSIAATTTWQDWINITMTDAVYAINTGLFNREATPITTHMRVRAGGEDMPTMNIEQMATLDIARVFYEKPYAVRASDPYTVRVKADNTGIERLGLLGYAIARRPYLIREG